MWQFSRGGSMSGSTLIDAEFAGGEASFADLNIDGQLDLLEPVLASSLDAVITSAASSPDFTLDGADRDDYPVEPADATPSEANVLEASGVVQDSVADLAVDNEASVGLAADITGSGPDEGDIEQVSAEGAGGVSGNDLIDAVFESQAVDAPVASEPETVSGESGEGAPGAAMAMSVDGATLDGTTGAGLVYEGCWGELVDGGDGNLEWAYTRPYIIGDATGDVSYDIYPLPVEVDGGFNEEPGDWVYVEEGDEWIYLEEGEDWTYTDEDWTYVEESDEWLYQDEDWIYLDEWEDSGYIDESGEWVYADEGEDWIYLDEWEDWGYLDEGDEWVYADEGDGSDIISDPEVIVCWGYPDLMYSEAGDPSTSGEGDPVLLDGAGIVDGVESAGETFTAAILPLAASDLFIA